MQDVADDVPERSRGGKFDIAIGAGIFVFALALRLLYLFQIKQIPLFEILGGDSRAYYQWAQRIAAGDWLGEGVFFQAPLYPYFLGVVQLFLGNSVVTARVVQMILGAGSCVLLYGSGKLWFSRAVGICAGLLLAVYPAAIFFDGLIQKTVLDLFLLTLVLFLLAKAQREEGRRLAALGAALGLLGSTRENALVLVPVVMLWLVYQFRHAGMRICAARLGMLVAGLALALLPVTLRNLVIGGEFAVTTSNMGYNLFVGNNPDATGGYMALKAGHGDTMYERQDAIDIAQQALGRLLSPGEVSAYWRNRALSFIKNHPKAWLGLLWKKWLLTWNVRELEDTDDFYVYQEWSPLLRRLGVFHFGILAPLAAFGMVVTASRRKELWALYLMIASLALSLTVFYVFGRYRFSLVPLLILFASAGMAALPTLVRQRQWLSMVVATIIAVGCYFAAQYPVMGLPGPGSSGLNNLGVAFVMRREPGPALESFKRALQIAPDDEVAHYNIGSLLATQGAFSDADPYLSWVVKRHPDFVAARKNLGNLRVVQGDYQAAIEHYDAALRLRPGFKDARLNRAIALIKNGEGEIARRELQAIVDQARNPFDVSMENFLLSHKDLDEGVKQLKEYLKLPPDLNDRMRLTKILIW
jgi:tetratricopeptide (TPR) repeat protein